MRYIKPNWSAPKNIKAYTTVRSSWGEADPKSASEREKLSQLLKLPSNPIWLKQIHGNTAVMAKPELSDHIEADASYTNQANLVCAILTADCLPVLLCNKQGTHVAAVHAGWRGLATGVIENTVHALNLPSGDMMAWLGPGISSKYFEVGKDVFDAFTLNHPEAEQAFTQHTHDKWFADLNHLATLKLNSLGITSVYGGDMCTYSEIDLFPSFRRDKGTTQRIATTIWIAR